MAWLVGEGEVHAMGLKRRGNCSQMLSRGLGGAVGRTRMSMVEEVSDVMMSGGEVQGVG